MAARDELLLNLRGYTPCGEDREDDMAAQLLDAYRAEVLREAAQGVRKDADLIIEGLDDNCCRSYGLALARWLDPDIP